MYSKYEYFKTLQELERGTSNLLVADMFWMVEFTRPVIGASLFEQMPSRINTEIWK